MTTFVTLLGISLYLVLMFYIAYRAYKTNKHDDPEDWFLMGRGANTLMLVGTMFATWFSTFAFLGGPGFFYKIGVNWLLFGFFNAMGPVMVMVLGPRIWALGKKFNFITPGDLLATYYNSSRRIRILTGLICIAVLFPYSAIQITGIAIALNSISGGLIAFNVGVLLIAVCVGVYSFVGGSRAVVWTDVIQGFIFALLLLGTMLLVIRWAGGWSEGWVAATTARPEMFIFDGGAGNYITLMTLWTFGWVLTPHLWQRLYMADSPQTLVKGAAITSFLALFVVTFTGVVIGMMSLGMDITIPEGSTTDALVPEIFAQYLPAMGVVLVIAVFAAGMSTLDSQMISATSSFTQDLVPSIRNVDNSQRMRLARYFEVAFVLALVAFAFSPQGRSLIAPLASIGVGMALSFLLPLLGALFWNRASEPAAFWGMLLGWGVMVAMQFNLLPNPGLIGPPLWGLIVSAVVFFGGSLLRDDPVDPARRKEFQDDMADRFPETNGKIQTT
ncbi:sodium:solute symporter family protein [Marinovum sp. 2_MG-2023]|uniref:sodium:solute symporter family protein n=1 Tax=unclassified Marinovum TaxID=2647166 RepID=UPI0026E1E3D8|nr:MULTISPECIES: sodium:solute symporter family protein [unclassified Marinovum]MDO6731989.1 sodium:solute symporter family protein [Marinovum sp. 2_MG-2023]MDO6781241.1 sodium:solute symporter family protein [Marinovum sp. 1_MG-2023]